MTSLHIILARHKKKKKYIYRVENKKKKKGKKESPRNDLRASYISCRHDIKRKNSKVQNNFPGGIESGQKEFANDST